MTGTPFPKKKKKKPLGCENFCPLQGSFGPFGPKVAKRVRNEFPGPLGPGSPKSPKRSRKRVKIVEKLSILTRFRLCFGLFGPPGPRGPGNLFRTLFATLGSKSPNDPCSRARESQPLGTSQKFPDSLGPRIRRLWETSFFNISEGPRDSCSSLGGS